MQHSLYKVYKISYKGYYNYYAFHAGGPAKPEVSYEVLAEQKEIVLLWPRPFTWEEYPITEYHIMCTDTDVISINNTDNRAVIQHTVELDQDITDCHTLQCNVTACNVLDDSIPSVTDISIPLSELQTSTCF